MANDRILSFGGSGGTGVVIDPKTINGKKVEIWAGSVIDSIRIIDGKSSKRFGGEGGKLVETIESWPGDGIIELQFLAGATHNSDNVVSHVRFRAGSQQVSAGGSKSLFSVDADLAVKLTGIHSGSFVDRLSFEVMEV